MNEQQNVRLVQQAYDAFKRGEIQGVLNSLSEQVEWRVPKPEGVPFGGEYRGREQVARFFSELNQYEDVTRFEPREYIAQGERVVAFGYFGCKVRATGRTAESEWVHVHTIRNGKIVKFQEFYDTAASLIAHRTAATPQRTAVPV